MNICRNAALLLVRVSGGCFLRLSFVCQFSVRWCRVPPGFPCLTPSVLDWSTPGVAIELLTMAEKNAEKMWRTMTWATYDGDVLVLKAATINSELADYIMVEE